MLDDHDGPEAPDPLDDKFGIPVVVPPLPVERQYARQMPIGTVMHWLRAGWRDLWTNPLPSLLYGLLLFGLSVLMIWLLYRFDMEHTVFPALAGFMVLGPLIANGLYVKSRNLELGQRTGFMQMILVQPRSAGSSLFMGVILLMLFMLWIRAAIILWAVFFGIQPFPGMDEILPTLFTTPRHPYSAMLLEAAPSLARRKSRGYRRAAQVKGDLPSPMNLPPGCAFATRCPRVQARCHAENPRLRDLGATRVACHYPINV